MTRMVKADIDKYRELIIAIMKRIMAMTEAEITLIVPFAIGR